MRYSWRNAFTRWINRRYVGETPPVRLTQRRIYILPTKAGLLFGSTVLVMLLGAINYNLSLGFILVFLLGGMGIAALLHTYRGLAGLVLRPGRCAPVFAGDSATLTVLLNNAATLPRYNIELSPAADTHTMADVGAGEEAIVPVSVPASRRGVLRFDRWRVSTTFPLGVFRAWSYAHLGHELLVYPQPEPAGPPPPLQSAPAREGVQGERGLEDFSGLRRYQEGDSLKHIAWKALARGHPMLSKQFSGGAQPELHLRWQDTDARASTESRLSRLCRWVLEATRANQTFSLELPGERIALGQGTEHEARCLRALALHDESESG